MKGISQNINDIIKPTSFIGVATSDSQKDEILHADWQLSEGSSCINAGTSTYIDPAMLSGTDLNGKMRVQYGTIDIGAYEYTMPTVSIPINEDFNGWNDFEKSELFYRSAKLNTLNDIRWLIENQKAVFSSKTNLTTTYDQPFSSYQIDGSKTSKVFLRYDMNFVAYSGSIATLGTEKLAIEVSTDFITWTNIANYSNLNGSITNNTYLKDISSLVAGKSFFVRFRVFGSNTNNIEKWEIDNVIIDADGLSEVNTVQEDKYNYSVNNGILNIANLGQASLLQLFDVNGKLLSIKNTDSQSYRFILPTQGVYVVKVTSDSDIENKKIVW